jgi:hypothetical protein
MNRHREPRGGRSFPFAVSKEPAESWAALCPSPYRRKESRSWGDGRDGRGYQMCAAPTPCDRASRPSQHLHMLFVKFFCRSWYFCLLSLCLCYEFREQEREASTWQVPLVALCSSISFICLKRAATTAGIERPIKIVKSSSTFAYHFLVLDISKARMNNNQRNKQHRQRQPAAAVARGRSGRISFPSL